MPNVPSVPAPSQELSSGALATQQITPPPGAFAANILGEVASKLGATTQETSDMLAKHAEAMQTVTNKADSDTANTGFSKEASALHNDFTTNQVGPAAAKTFGDYSDKLEQLRLKWRDTLGNDQAKGFFSSESRAKQSILFDSMGNFAAKESRKYVNTAADAKMGNAIDFGTTHWDNPAAVASARAEIDGNAAFHAQMENWQPGDGIKENYTRINTSKLWTGVLASQMIADAPGAQKKFEEVRGEMTEPEQKSMENALRTAVLPQQAASFYAGWEHSNAAAAILAPGGKTDPRAVFDNVIIKHEGTAYVAHDANGAAVRYGINAAANPDVNLKTLTKEGAYQRFLTKYWGPSGAASLPPALAAIHADTFFMNEVQAQKILKASGGDPSKYMDLREQFFAKLEAKPTLAKYKKAWDARNADLRTLIGGGPGVDLSTVEGIQAAVPQFQAAVDASFPPGPQRDAAMREGDAHLSALRMGLEGQARASYGRIVTWMSGGESHNEPLYRSPAELQAAHPEAVADIKNLTGQELEGLNKMYDHNSSPTAGMESPGQFVHYAYLRGLALTNPAAFIRLNPLTDEHFQALPMKQQRALQLEQLKLRQGHPPATIDKQVTTMAGPMMSLAFGNDKEGRAQFLGELREDAITYEKINKKIPDEAWVKGHGQYLIANNRYQDSGRVAGKSGLVEGVPNDEATAIATTFYDLRAKGLVSGELSNAQIVKTYQANLARRRGR